MTCLYCKNGIKKDPKDKDKLFVDGCKLNLDHTSVELTYYFKDSDSRCPSYESTYKKN